MTICRQYPTPSLSGRSHSQQEGRRQRLRGTLLAVVALLAGLLLTGGAQAADRVLLINIAEYQVSGASLPGLEKDIPLMQEVVGRLGFSEDQVRVLRDAEATKSGIERAVREWLIAGVGNEDRVIFYYSGHGAQAEDDTAPGGCRTGLLTHDMVLLLDRELQALIAQIPARETMILIDSCFSGGAVRSRLSGNLTNAKVFQPMAVECNVGVNQRNLEDLTRGFNPRPNQLIMTASAHNEVAVMNRDTGSFFTVALHQAATAAGDDISFEELRAETSTIIREYLAESRNYLPHTPQLLGNSEWFHKNFFSFGSLATAGEIPPESPDDSGELIDHIVNNSQFRVEMVSPESEYRLGEALTLKVSSSKPGYINILDLGPDGNLTLLFPNRFNGENRISADVTLDIPGPEFGNFNLIAAEPTGESRLLTLVTTRPLNLFDSNHGSLVGETFRLFGPQEFDGLLTEMSQSIVAVAEQDMQDEHGAATLRLSVAR